MNTEVEARLPPWDGHDLKALLALQATAPGHWRSRHGDPNANGRSYGGQLLGQGMAAAVQGLAPDRLPTMMQFLFLQGADPQQAIDFEVTALQDGKRFSSRHVRARQAGRYIFDAQVSAAVEMPAVEHQTDSLAPPGEDPQTLPGLADLPASLLAPISRRIGHPQEFRPCLEFRIPDAEQQLTLPAAKSEFRFWLRVRQDLGAHPLLQAAALAYMSDWWLNISSLLGQLHESDAPLYNASLNHSLWMHRAPRADQWLHVHSSGPISRAGRGLSSARIHDLQGRMVATTVQESLIVVAG